MTKVLVINGSPRKGEGNTAGILAPFIGRMEDAGASVELLYAADLDVNDCLADFNCWFQNPGECIQNDGMQEIYPKVREADILILATPVYIPIPGCMANFLNRMCPIIEPELEFRDGRTRGRRPEGVKLSKLVLVSTSGWWEVENMGIVLKIVQELAMNLGVEFGGAVLRPHAFILREKPDEKREIRGSLRKAGRMLIESGSMPTELLDSISRPLLPEPELRDRYRSSYERAKGG